MNRRLPILIATALAALMVTATSRVAAAEASAPAAPAPTAAAPAAAKAVAAATNAAPVSTNAPTVDTNAFVSTFDSKARDPFYPHSSRASFETATDGSADVSSPTVILVLKGISGSPKRRTAIINDHTFMVGDESEVPITSGRIRLHCHEIRADSVIISLGSSPEKTELRMPLRY